MQKHTRTHTGTPYLALRHYRQTITGFGPVSTVSARCYVVWPPETRAWTRPKRAVWRRRTRSVTSCHYQTQLPVEAVLRRRDCRCRGEYRPSAPTATAQVILLRWFIHSRNRCQVMSMYSAFISRSSFEIQATFSRKRSEMKYQRLVNELTHQ